MLQFITKYPDSRSITDQVRSVVEGGCRWVELSAPTMSEEEIRKVAEEITPICRETETFVIMREHPDIAGEFRFHGILLNYSDNPRSVRERLGGEAIIGVKVSHLDELKNLRLADIDYFVLDAEKDIDHAISLLTEARKADVKKPIVAEGEFSIPQIKMLLEAGFSGIAMSSTLADATDPAAATKEVMEVLYGGM